MTLNVFGKFGWNMTGNADIVFRVIYYRTPTPTPTATPCPPGGQSLGLNDNELGIQSTAVCQANTSTPTATATNTPTPTPMPTPLPNQRGLRVETFTNNDLQGTPIVQVYSPSTTTPFQFNFVSSQFTGPNPPPFQLPQQSENYSIRFTGHIWLPESAEGYHFWVSNDDGVRLIIEGQTVTEDWNRPLQGAWAIPPGNKTEYITGTTVSRFYTIEIHYRQLIVPGASIEIQYARRQNGQPGTPTLLTFENLYLPNGTLTPPTAMPSPTPNIPLYAILRANATENAGAIDWTPSEVTAIDTAVNNVGLALQRLSVNPTSPQAVFNRVMVQGSVKDYIWFVRANTTTSTIQDLANSPDVTVSYIHEGQTVSVTYENINGGNSVDGFIPGCKAFASALSGTIPRPPAVVCNLTFTPTEHTFVHELGHIFDYRAGYPNNGISSAIAAGSFTLGSCPSSEFTDPQTGAFFNYRVMGYFAELNPPFRRGERGWGTGPGFSTFQQNPENIPLEAAADMFLNWVYGSNSSSGTSPVTGVQTNAAAPTGGCPVNQSVPPPSQNWDGFRNNNWSTSPYPYDWGLPGDVRYVYMNGLMVTIFAGNTGW
ncbi:MAG: PA14 domain-containing protein [Chloroflexota bacterium]|nr:PA14 domain-containing protein [Chloroflexota bacterium]